MVTWRAIALSVFLVGVSVSAVCQPASPRVSADTVRYSYLLAGELAGTYERTTLAERSYRLELKHSSSAGTTAVSTTVTFDEQWFPLRMVTTGHDAAGHDAAETFGIDGFLVRWKNLHESGSAHLVPKRFYSSAAAPLDETRALVLAARASRDGCVELLPTGRACVRKALEKRVSVGKVEQTVHAWAVRGVGFRPLVVWLDESGELFATVSPWASAIREGWEPVEEVLLESQENWVAQELRTRTAELTRRPAGRFAIRNARLFDSVTGEVHAGMCVVIEGTRILRVAPDPEVDDKVVETIDARGAMLLPGLWDMHVHDLPADGLLALASGTTTVRRVGGRVESLAEMRHRFENGTAGPRLIFSGLINGRTESVAVSGELVGDESEAKAAVQRYADAGANGIKIYASVPQKLIPVIVDEAHGRGLSVGGHVPQGFSLLEAVRLGYNEISHLWTLAGGFSAPMPDASAEPGKNEIVRRLLAFDPTSTAAQTVFSLLRSRHITVDPTIGSFEDSLGADSIVAGIDATHGSRAGAELPPAIRRSNLGGTLFRSPVDQATRDAAVQKLRSILMELRKNGVAMIVGGDGLPGIALQREMTEWSVSGIPNTEILQSATLGNARAAGRESSLGSIQPGKLADLILVEGDPVARIADIAKVKLTIKDGAIYDAPGLLRTLGIDR